VSFGDEHVAGREPEVGWVIRRDAFDARLAAQVMGRGVEVRQGARVRGLRRDHDGVTLSLDDGSTLRARAVVGADGITGFVRTALGLPRGHLRAQAIEVDTERVASDVATDTIHFAFRPELRGYLWDFPTPIDGEVGVSRGVYLLRDRRAPDDRDPRQHLRAHLARSGLDLGHYRTRQLAERGLEPTQAISRPRVILVGEAAGIDFPTGEGIAQAILHGRLAADYLIDKLTADRLDFADWRARWVLSDEGRFLRRRLLGGRALFGLARPRLERALLRSPAVFHAVLRRFAGRPLGRGDLATAALQLGRGVLASLSG
jgi:flavin-dependent dehydrogenase